MKKLSVTSTTLGLALAGITRDPAWIPLVVANAVVGMAYMHLERDSLARIGGRNLFTMAFGLPPWRLKTYAENLAVNVLAHGILTVWVLSRLRPMGGLMGGLAGVERFLPSMIMELLGLCVLNLPEIYPSDRPLEWYIAAHLTTLTFTSLLLGGRPGTIWS